MGYNTPYNKGYNPPYNLNNQGFLHIAPLILIAVIVSFNAGWNQPNLLLASCAYVYMNLSFIIEGGKPTSHLCVCVCLMHQYYAHLCKISEVLTSQ